MTTSNELYSALLRPAVLQVLRATGFSYAKPVVIDALTDLAARYILLLGSSVAQNAANCHSDHVPTIQDVRVALAENGALRPQMMPSEEASRGTEEINGELVPFEDMRGVMAFVGWAQGSVNKEIRRIAGFGDEIDVNEIAAGVDETEDYLTALKKKHSKTAEESRYQGTTLGKEADIAPIPIVGSEITSISEWVLKQSKSGTATRTQATTNASTPATSFLSSVPSTPKDPDETAGEPV